MIKNILKMKTLDWIILVVFVLSYSSVNFKHPFYANNLWDITFDIYNFCPDFFNLLFFSLSLFLLLKSNFLVTKNLNKWQSTICLFLYINPFVWKNLFIPVNNILFAFSIFISTICFNYIRSHEFKKEMVMPYSLLAISFSLINLYFIIYFCALSVVMELFQQKEKNSYLKVILTAFLMGITTYYFIFFHDLDILSEHISLFINNSIHILYSFWGFLLLFSLIGIIIFLIKNLKRINVAYIIKSLLFILIIIMISFTTLFNSMTFPYALLIVIGTLLLYKDAPLIGKIIASFMLLFSISSFYCIIDNYQKDMEFKETIINHIITANKKYHFQVIIGKLPDSPEKKSYNFYPENFFYQNPTKYQYIMKQNGLNVIFIGKNDINNNFNIYKSEKIKDFKYFTIYKQNKITYLYMKNILLKVK